MTLSWRTDSSGASGATNELRARYVHYATTVDYDVSVALPEFSFSSQCRLLSAHSNSHSQESSRVAMLCLCSGRSLALACCGRGCCALLLRCDEAEAECFSSCS